LVRGLGCGCCEKCKHGWPSGEYTDDFSSRDSGWLCPPPHDQSEWEKEWVWDGSTLTHTQTTTWQPNGAIASAVALRPYCYRQAASDLRYNGGPVPFLIAESFVDVVCLRPPLPMVTDQAYRNSIGLQLAQRESPVDGSLGWSGGNTGSELRSGRPCLVWERVRRSDGRVRDWIYFTAEWTNSGFSQPNVFRFVIYDALAPPSYTSISGRVGMRVARRISTNFGNTLSEFILDGVVRGSLVYFAGATENASDQEASRRWCSTCAILYHSMSFGRDIWNQAPAVEPPEPHNYVGIFDNYELTTYNE
jgi:hypothetical protein